MGFGRHILSRCTWIYRPIQSVRRKQPVNCEKICLSGEGMPEKPKFAQEYTSEHLELVKAMCLYLATKLGDYMNDRYPGRF